jgi:spermidine/putrescine transport system substrate-binding protein
MKRPIIGMLAAAGMLLLALPANAGGELNIFNWGNYTNPKLIEKFEAAHGVKVTLSDYDSNDSMLAKIKAGGHGYDIVVPSDYMVKVRRAFGLHGEGDDRRGAAARDQAQPDVELQEHDQAVAGRLFR